jgi:electron-transferring-flavoprotein dehydrogenase
MGREREILELDVLFVGAGPANLAGAYHLNKLIKAHDEAISKGQKKGKKIGEIAIGVIEKGREIGAHILSGAVMDPKALKELMPDFLEQGAPVEAEVTYDKVLFLTQKSSFAFPITPPPLVNHGNYVVSLGKIARWLGKKVEEADINVFTETPGAEVLLEGDKVIGIRTGDKGIGKEGKQKGNYEPGVDILAKVTVLGEGSHGSLTKKLKSRLKLDTESNPQVYAIGVKEIWELPKGRVNPGHVYHTMGFPMDNDTYGGGWIYHMKDDLLDIGLVVGLDYKNPFLDPHAELQRYKTHPYLKSLLEGGKLIAYGAKTIPEGGLFCLPKLYSDGLLIVGDSAGFLNSARLKGIHLAMKSGMLAAETIFESLVKDDFSAKELSNYDSKFRNSWAYHELHQSRNFHQAFKDGNLVAMFHAGLQMAFEGNYWGVFDRAHNEPGHVHMQKLYNFQKREPEKHNFDGKLTFDKLTNVYYSSTKHDEDQPCHLKVLEPNICVDRCVKEYGNPCQYFCPAKVYEMVDEGNKKKLHINFANCVHCKTCDIMDPYQIIDWVTPEGGGGPSYTLM